MKRTLKTQLKVPKGYEIEDLYDTDDIGYEFGQAPLEEEVGIDFGEE